MCLHHVVCVNDFLVISTTRASTATRRRRCSTRRSVSSLTSRRVANNPIRPRGALFRSRLPQFKPLATPAAVMRAAGYPHCHRLTEDIDHDTTKVRKKNRADFLPTGTAARWMFSLTSQEVAAGISRFVRKAHNYAEMAAGLNGHRSPVAVGHTTSKVRVVRSDDYGVRTRPVQTWPTSVGSDRE